MFPGRTVSMGCRPTFVVSITSGVVGIVCSFGRWFSNPFPCERFQNSLRVRLCQNLGRVAPDINENYPNKTGTNPRTPTTAHRIANRIAA